MSVLTVQNVSKTYPGGVSAVRDVSFTVPAGAFCVLVGPSGCGKSTTLRMIAGLEGASSGTISIGDRVINDVHPKDRDIAMVFQSYALYPHLTVRQNIAFPLTMRGVGKDEIATRVGRVAQMMQLSELLHRRPAHLSGGQRQRVALARAVVREPKVFLFDEPLSNLDARMRTQTRNELKALHQRLRITSVYVTHDQEEAMSLADIVVVMSGGSARQIGTPFDIFEKPADRFVAGFIGSPVMNFFSAKAAGAGRSLRLEVGEGMSVPTNLPTVRAGGSYELGIRPSFLRLDRETTGDGASGCIWMQALVFSVEFLGEVMDVAVRVASLELVVRAQAHRGIVLGQRVWIGLDPQHVHVFEDGSQGRALGRALGESGERTRSEDTPIRVPEFPVGVGR